jgi:hypothetical protein
MRCRWLLPLALLAVPGPARSADVTATTGKDTIEFKAGNHVVAKYQYAGTVQQEKGDGTKPLAKPFLWPVLAPNGVPVTAFAPSDHIHHKSVWFCHGDVIPEGVDIKTRSSTRGVKGANFWDENPGHGVIECVKVGESRQMAKDLVAVTTWNEWKSADGEKIIDEKRTISFQDLPAGRLFVFECKLTANTCPIIFGDTKEGSFGVRVNQEMRAQLPTGGTVTAADRTAVSAPAKDNLPVWGQLSDWNDYSGTVDGKAAGIAVFDHPSNPYRAAWHTRAYGLMAANPFGRAKSGFPSQKGKTDLVRLEKGKGLTFKYAVYAHSGDVKSGKVAEAYEAFKR